MLKQLRYERCDFRHSTTFKNIYFGAKQCPREDRAYFSYKRSHFLKFLNQFQPDGLTAIHRLNRLVRLHRYTKRFSSSRRIRRLSAVFIRDELNDEQNDALKCLAQVVQTHYTSVV